MTRRQAALRAKRLPMRVIRRALLRRARAAPRPGADPERVVILLSSAWGMGGTIRAALNLAGWLAQTRPVEIVTPYRRRDEPFFGEFPPGVEVIALADERPGHAPRGPRGLAYRVLHKQPSVLFPSTDRLYKTFSLWTDWQLVKALGGGRGTIIGTRPGLNVMITRLALPGYRSVGLEQLHLGFHKRGLKAQMAQTYTRLDAFVTLTERDRDSYDRLLKGRQDLSVIPNTVRPLGGPEPDHGAKLAVAAGRLLGLEGQKGFDLLMRAWVPVFERHPDWKVRIHGEGPARPKLERLRAELGLDDVVEMPGATEDMGGAMGEASIFVLSSRFEGFPLILLEAMSKGLACAAFDCPTGPADIIDDHANGLIVPDGDIAALSEALLELIGDEDLRRRCGAAARETAQQYTMEAIGPRWDRFLAELAAGA